MSKLQTEFPTDTWVVVAGMNISRRLKTQYARRQKATTGTGNLELKCHQLVMIMPTTTQSLYLPSTCLLPLKVSH